MCDACGYEWPPPELVQCPGCLVDVPLSSVVCPHCGFVFKEAEAVELREVPQAKPAPSGPVKAKVLSMSADPWFVSKKGNSMIALSFVVDLGTGGLPEQVRMFLDIEGQSGPWAEHKAELAWMRLADSAPPKTLDEARERLDELRKPAWAGRMSGADTDSTARLRTGRATRTADPVLRRNPRSLSGNARR
jgi:hypothetical protein